MDTEEDIEIQKSILEGHDLNERCSYAYDARKEGYKGTAKGYLGGAVIGATIGAVVGLGAAAVLPVIGVGAAVGTVGSMVAGFSAGGMLYGAHVFGDVGKSEATAAVAEKLEFRLKNFISKKFSRLEQDVEALKETKTVASGKDAKTIPHVANTDANSAVGDDAEHCPPAAGNKLIFWKVAAIGLTIGLAAGALLAFGGVSGHVLEMVGVAAEKLGEAGVMAASMTAMGLFGASFGINRDIAWNLFDRTDLWFKGLLTHQPSTGTEPAHQQSPVQAQSTEATQSASKKSPINTVVYDIYPDSETYHRDRNPSRSKTLAVHADRNKALAIGQEALHRLDPFNSPSH